MLALPLLIAALAPQSTTPSSTLGDWSWDSVRPLVVRTTTDGRRYVADELLLGLERDSARTECLAALATRGAELVGEIAPIHVLRVRVPADEDPLAVAEQYAALPGVEYAEPNDVGEGGAVGDPNDTWFFLQWHLRNTGQVGGLPGADIAALGAWSLVHHQEPVTLAILDTGIDFTHPEFLGRTAAGWDFVSEDADPSADHSHGVMCAGLAAANANNGFGVTGIDTHCTIVPLKVLNASNMGAISDLAQALTYCAAQRIDVVSMSLINYPITQSLHNALKRARGAGCILVACAGNGGIGNADVSGPGRSPLTISIGATDPYDRRASYSGTGSRLDFVAPGDGVYTVSYFHDDSAWGFGGCSAATPVAAGIVSLLKGFDRSLTQEEVYELLRVGAEDQVGLPSEDTLGRDTFFGWGRLNAWRSVAALFHMALPALYGDAKTTSLGTEPALATTGTPRNSWDDFSIDVDHAIPGELAVLYYGSAPDDVPWSGGSMLVHAPVVALRGRLLDADGHARFGIPIAESMIGTRRYYQAWFRDPGQQDGTAAGITAALEVAFGP